MLNDVDVLNSKQLCLQFVYSLSARKIGKIPERELWDEKSIFLGKDFYLRIDKMKFCKCEKRGVKTLLIPVLNINGPRRFAPRSIKSTTRESSYF